MHKMMAIFLLTALYHSIAMAETCPSVKAVKSKALKGWESYDSEDGTRLSLAKDSQFKKTIEEFALAEWPNEKNNKGTVHCYYRDASGSSLSAYLAKDNFIPQNHKNYWYQVTGFMQCAAGGDQCEFDQKVLGQQKRLARK